MSSRLDILYVEDEIIVALDVADSLEQDLGLVVTKAHNLQTAMDLIDVRSFDLALLDINLGHGERSIELGQTLQDRGTFVVFASGYNRSEMDDIEGFNMIEKPFQLTDLHAAFGTKIEDLREAQAKQTPSATV
ncbi:MAG: response regulator [Paracoccaceae bacterium]